MGCASSDEPIIVPVERVTGIGTNEVRLHNLRIVRRETKSVAVPICPTLTEEERNKLIASWQTYIDHVNISGGFSHFTEIIMKHPHIITTYFGAIVNPSMSTIDPDIAQLPPHVNEKFLHHQQVTLSVIKHVVMKAVMSDLADYEDSLRRVGALHAERWVTSKDMMCFEDSFMWSLEQVDPEMDAHLQACWRKLIRYMIHNIVVGINNHYAKLTFMLEPVVKRQSTCPCACKAGNSRAQEDLRASMSLRRMSAVLVPGRK